MITTDLASAPELTEELKRLNDSSWPRFLYHGDIRGWSSLYDTFAEFQLLFVERDTLAGGGLTIPLAWNLGDALPETLDEIVYCARWPLEQKQGVLCALGALVNPGFRRKGLSRRILDAMCDLASRKGLAGLLAPVRPTRKHEYPLESIEQYATRRNDSGSLFDPWLRVHEERGGRQLGVLHRSLTVTGNVDDWEQWSGLNFAGTGEYTIEHALTPVSIDGERNVGEYVEPNIWYYHEAV
jgi:hypothetical protein